MIFGKENTGSLAAPTPLHIRPDPPPPSPFSFPSPTYRPQSLSIDLRVSETMSEFDTEKCASAAKQHSEQDDTELEVPYSSFTTAEKRVIVTIAALTTLIPPLTGSMYYPVIPTLAHDLGVSVNDISYTITAYLVRDPPIHSRNAYHKHFSSPQLTSMHYTDRSRHRSVLPGKLIGRDRS